MGHTRTSSFTFWLSSGTSLCAYDWQTKRIGSLVWKCLYFHGNQISLILALKYMVADIVLVPSWNNINPLHPEGKFSGQLKQSARYVHSCLQQTTLIRSRPSNQAFGNQGMVWQKIQEPLTLGAIIFGVIEIQDCYSLTLCSLILYLFCLHNQRQFCNSCYGVAST